MGSACIVTIILVIVFARCSRQRRLMGFATRDPKADDDGRTCLIARVEAAGSYFRDFMGRARIACRITSRGAIA